MDVSVATGCICKRGKLLSGPVTGTKAVVKYGMLLLCLVFMTTYSFAASKPLVTTWSASVWNKTSIGVVCSFSGEPSKTALCNRSYWCHINGGDGDWLTQGRFPEDPQLTGDNLCRFEGGDSFFSYAGHAETCLNGETPVNGRCPDVPKNFGNNQCASVGNPVNIGIGNKFQVETDFQSNQWPEFAFKRYYNSGRPGRSSLRLGWRHSFSGRITRQWSSGSAVVFRPDGKSYYFFKVSGAWIPDADIRDRLENLVDSSGTFIGWRLTTADDVAETYNRDGQPVLIEYRNGLTLSLVYTNTLLTSVQSSTGETLAFTYDINSRLRSLTAPGDRTWSYNFITTDLLGSVDNPDGTTRQYHYNEPSLTSATDLTAALTGITDERGIRYASFGYDAQARAIMSTHAGGVQQVTINYDPDPAVYPAGSRIVTNSRGHASVYSTAARQGVHLVTRVAGPGCATCGAGDIAYAYDPANNNLLSKTESGVTTEYGDHDDNGNPGYRIEASGTSEERRTEYTYDPRFPGRVLGMTEPSVYAGGSKVTSYKYDDFGNRISATVSGFTPAGEPVVRSSSWQFNGPLNQLSLIDGPRTGVSDITLFRYYANDASAGSNRARLREVEDATGSLIRSNIQYTDTGKVASETRPNGLNITYTYYPGNDRLETLAEVGAERTRVTRWTYFPTGEVETITVAYGTQAATTTAFQYDAARRLTRITDGLGNYIEYILDTEGNRVAENTFDNLSALEKTLAQTFDMYNRLDVTNQANEVMDFDYAPDGTLAQQVNGKGDVSIFGYDGLKRLLATTQDLGGLGAVTQYDYDVSGNVISVTDPANGNTAYQYDDLGNLVQLASPDTGTTVFSYDAAGNLTGRQDALGSILVYTWDELNRLTGVDARSVTDDLVYVYDTCTNGSGRLCSVLSGTSLVTYVYDAFGNVTAHQKMTYSHDAANRVRTVTYPSGAIVTYHYDAAGQVSQVGLEADDSITTLASNISYVPFGSVENLTFGNGTTLMQSFDLAYRMTDQQVPGVLGIGYLLYDANGNLKSRLDSISGMDSFSYDTLNRLETGVGSFGTRDYDYDLNGNRVGLYDGSAINYGYSPGSNRLLNETGWTYSLDANGNTTEKINSGGDGRFYVYNSHNRLESVSSRTTTPVKGKNKPPVVVDTVIASYTYNGLGQRVNKDAGGAVTRFLYGTDGALMAELDGEGTVRREYIYLNKHLLAALDYGLSASDGAEDIIVENGTAPAGWSVKTSNKDYGSNYLYSDGGSENPVRWTPSLGAGDYEVSIWYVKNRKYSNSVPYTVSHNGGTDTVAVDQSTGGGEWLPLGTYTFDGAGNEYVEVSDDTGKTTADAVRFVSVDGGSVPTVTTLSYIHNDHLGTPKAMTDESGSVVWRSTHDPFGAATVDPSSTVEMNVRFPGQYYDSETGLHYNYFRYYAPETGRYHTYDSIGLAGGINPYLYADANPLTNFDPLGLDTITYGANLRIPTWLAVPVVRLLGLDTTPNGIAVGVAASFPGFFGGEFDSGVFAALDLGGLEFGAKITEGFSYNKGSVCDLAGVGVDVGGFAGFIGGGVSLDNNGDLTGIYFQRGLGLGGGYNATGTLVLSNKHGLIGF
jgi:RHS repeat-associated protein